MKQIIASLFALATLTALSVAPAHAQTYPWCAYLGPGGEDGTNCGFTTYQQCMDTIFGVGGYCQENPRYRGPAPQPAKRTTPKKPSDG